MKKHIILGILALLITLLCVMSIANQPVKTQQEAAKPQEVMDTPFGRLTREEMEVKRKEHLKQLKDDDIKWEKIKYQEAVKKKGGKVPKGWVPTSDYTESDWADKRKDGQAGLDALPSRGE